MSSLAGPALSRWSGDAWLVVRPGNSGASRLGGVVPTYGASQAGAVLRYTLASGSGHRPAVYLRAVQALSGARDSDAAIGVTARLVPALPVAAHVEARATSRASGTDLRPAVFLSAGGERNGLVAGFAARGYAQAGYVGGRDATAFADGSIVADRRLWSGSGATATAGLGAWGGAQRGAARLDLGPTAGVVLRVGKASARLSVDYRLRVAGDASPSSGPALTLSGGF